MGVIVGVGVSVGPPGVMDGIAVGIGAGNGWHAAKRKIADNQINFFREGMETFITDEIRGVNVTYLNQPQSHRDTEKSLIFFSEPPRLSGILKIRFQHSFLIEGCLRLME